MESIKRQITLTGVLLVLIDESNQIDIQIENEPNASTHQNHRLVFLA